MGPRLRLVPQNIVVRCPADDALIRPPVQWNSVFTGFGSTNWGGKGLPNADGYPTDMFFAQAYSHFVGGSKGFRGKKNYELDFGKSGALLESSSSCNI